MHGLDDVAPPPQGAQRRLERGVDPPAPRLQRLGQPETFELFQPAELERLFEARKARLCGAPAVEHAGVGLAQDFAVEKGEPLLGDFGAHRLLDFQIGAQAEFLGQNLARLGAHAVGDVIARDDQIAAAIVLAAQHDMRVRMLRVVMIDRDPIETGVEVGFHPRHHSAHIGFEVGQLGTVLGRHDDPKLMTVPLAALQEGLAVRGVGLGAVELAGLAVAIDALALNVGHMQPRRGGPASAPAPGQIGDMELHDDAAAAQAARGPAPGGDMSRPRPAPDAGSGEAGFGRGTEAARIDPADGGEDAAHMGPGGGVAAGSDTSEPGLERIAVAVVGHPRAFGGEERAFNGSSRIAPI